MVGSEDRPNRMMWFVAGAVTMAVYLQGPHALIDKGYDLAGFAAAWVHSL